MPPFNTLQLPEEPTILAPDGSEVRVLLALQGGGMAHFRLAPGQVSAAVSHRSVAEIWYVLSGAGQMWRRQGTREVITDLLPGLCLTIPLGTAFQFRAAASSPLIAVAITMPPWPGPEEAMVATGPWEPSSK
jgi:mannose-6-phosphate isomerase-like protein (cupin superfamily)